MSSSVSRGARFAAAAAFALSLTAVNAANDGSGTNGVFCGDYLGANSALLAPVRGYGTFRYNDTAHLNLPPQIVSFQDAMLIVTLTPPTTSLADAGKVFPTVKVTECIYTVTADFVSSALLFTTGPPGLQGASAAQRCWRATTADGGSGMTVVRLQRNEPGKACPSSTSALTDDATGILNDFTVVTESSSGGDAGKLPAGLQPACNIPPPSAGAPPPLDGVAVSSTNFWVGPTFIAYTRPASDPGVAALGFGPAVWQYCVQGVEPSNPPPSPDSAGTSLSVGVIVSQMPNSTSAAPGGAGATACQYIKFNTASSLVSLLPPAVGSSACVATGNVGKMVFSVSINALPSLFSQYLANAQAAATPPPPPPPAARPDTLQQFLTQVLSTTLTINGLPANYDVTAGASPCSVFALRSSIAGSTGTTLSSVTITSVTFGASSVQVAATSPGNLQTTGCTAVQIAAAAAARRLAAGAAPAGASARALQATSLSANVQVATAPSASAATVAAVLASVTNSSASAAAAAFAAAQPPSAGVSAASLTATVAAPAVTTQTVLLVPTITRVSVYTPSYDITSFHSIPRIAVAGAKASNNILDVLDCKGSVMDYLKCGYLQGAIGPAAGIIAFAVLFFVLYELIYICSCCCRGCFPRCYPKRDPEVYFGGCRKHCGPARALVVFGVINIGLALASLAYLPRFNDAISGLFNVANDLANVLLNSAAILVSTTTVTFMDGTMGPSLLSGLQTASDSASCLSRKSDANTPSAVKTILDALGANLGGALNALDPISTSATSFSSVVTNLLNGINIKTIQNYETLAGYIICGFLAANIFVWSALVCKNSCASCVFKMLSPLKIFIMMLVGILAGFYYLIGIVGADVCYDPFLGMRTALNITGISGDSADTLNYYLNCGANAALKPSGFLTMLAPTADLLNFAATQAASLNATIATVPTPPSVLSLVTGANATCSTGTVAGGVASAATAFTQLQNGPLGCVNIDGILNRLFIALCNDGFGNVIAICRILIALAVMLVVQLGVGVDVCCYHPGDPRAWGAPEAEVGKVAPNVASIELSLRAPAAGHAHAGAAPRVLGGGGGGAQSGHTKV